MDDLTFLLGVLMNIGCLDLLLEILSKEDHEVHLKLVLELLKKEKLFAYKIEAMKNKKYLRHHPGYDHSWDWQEWAKEQEEAFQTLKGNLLCTHAKRQGRERDRKNAAWPEPTNGKGYEGGVDKTYYDLRDMYGGHVWRRILLPISWWKIYFTALVDIAEGIENTAKTCVLLIILKRTDKRCMEGSVGHMVFWAEIGEIQSIGSELVQETTNKVMLIEERLKAARDCQKSYVAQLL
ncbi:hypothetical protein Tco_1294155 [Tanacetum coccineum]